MRAARWIGLYAGHDDRLAAASNLLALSIVANQPFYPVMVSVAAGKFVPASLWTLLSAPGFAAVPALARRSPALGKSLLILTGIANTLLCVALYGEDSGVGLFLLPCVLIAALSFRPSDRLVQMPLLGLSLASFIGVHRPVSDTPGPYAELWFFHAVSVAMLTALIGLVFAGASQSAQHDPGQGHAERG